MLITLQLELERKTKRALRYRELDDGGAPIKSDLAHVGTVYVRKSAFNGEEPKKISIAISADER
jgi:hypothetical protein